MKQVLLLHGRGGTPENFWFPFISAVLQEKGYFVTVPQLPPEEPPSLEKLVSSVKKSCNLTSVDLIIGVC